MNSPNLASFLYKFPKLFRKESIARNGCLMCEEMDWPLVGDGEGPPPPRPTQFMGACGPSDAICSASISNSSGQSAVELTFGYLPSSVLEGICKCQIYMDKMIYDNVCVRFQVSMSFHQKTCYKPSKRSSKIIFSKNITKKKNVGWQCSTCKF